MSACSAEIGPTKTATSPGGSSTGAAPASGGGGGFRPAGQPATQPATIALYMHVCLTALALKISR